MNATSAVTAYWEDAASDPMATHRTSRRIVALVAASLLAAFGTRAPTGAHRRIAAGSSILFITLDTTRADAIGPEASSVETPAFDAVAAPGVRERALIVPILHQSFPSFSLGIRFPS